MSNTIATKVVTRLDARLAVVMASILAITDDICK